MGSFMREFWIPACMSSELERDKAPTRLMILGEKLIAFRDSNGRVGVLDHRCPHRCASLFFGRNEEAGLRCVYHGWKFDVEGNCLDMPNVPPKFEFSPRVKAKAYRTMERAGLVWIYMGNAVEPPPMPQLDALLLDPEVLSLSCAQRECNWLQSMEGDIDTSHFGFLHVGSVADEDVDPHALDASTVLNRQPEYFCKETDWGTMYTGYRDAPAPDTTYYRFSQFHLPFWTQFPDGAFEDHVVACANVPMDDEHTMLFFVIYKGRSESMRRLKDGSPIPGLEYEANGGPPPYEPNDSGWYGRWRRKQRASNDYLIDREAQERNNYSGIQTLFSQDSAMVESMGEIVDRTLEHLAPSDIMINRTRRSLLKAVRSHMNDGSVPEVLTNPSLSRGVRSGSFLGPKTTDWIKAYEDALKGCIDPVLTHAEQS